MGSLTGHDAVAPYARYRAPSESGQKLIAPPWSDLAALVAENVAWRGRQNVVVLNRPLGELVAAARSEILERSGRTAGTRVAEALDHGTPWIVAGHQPELFHPGVWLKNFAAAELARAHDGVGLHVAIDADLCRSPTILVPGGTVEAPLAVPIEFDAPAPPTPWEERRIVDLQRWQSFAERVREAAPLLVDPMLDAWWPLAVEQGAATNRLGAAFAQARHAAETAWGRHNLELPQSQACQTEAFRWFASGILLDLPRFADAYNGVLHEYRRAHGVRNHAHPMPDLGRDGPWLEAPFWVWTANDPRRRPLFAQPTGGGLRLSDRGGLERKLPLANVRGAKAAVDALADWEAAGVKLRSRALVTTMFLRLAVADLFLHGIGGAKYDEATDAICRRFFGEAPPAFAAVSGTLRLPINHPGGSGDTVRRLHQELRELRYHPELRLDLDALGANEKRQATAAAERKAKWLATRKDASNARQRHQEIVAANATLQELLAADRARLEWALADATAQARANRVLDSREYAYCLFPLSLLEQFLLDFTSPAL